MAYVIRDQETGNYANTFSVIPFMKEKTVVYSTTTGSVSGFEYYPTIEYAQKVVDKLQEILHKYNINKSFDIVECRGSISRGEIIHKHFLIESCGRFKNIAI